MRLRLGTEAIELTEFLAPRGRPMPSDVRANDRVFQHIAIVVSDIDQAYARLKSHAVEHASTGPQRLPDWNPNAGGISAFYFRDPGPSLPRDHRVPTGQGRAPVAGKPTQNVFLGIDHTAIVVDDTERVAALLS